MFGFKLIKAGLLNAKVKVGDVKGIIDGLDENKDGCISIAEIIDGVKKLVA